MLDISQFLPFDFCFFYIFSLDTMVGVTEMRSIAFKELEIRKESFGAERKEDGFVCLVGVYHL